MSDFGRKFYDVLRLHIENGIPVPRLSLSERQKARVEIIDDLYAHYRHNPAMNVQNFIRNKYGLTSNCELYNLQRALNFVVSMLSQGQRDMQRYKANFYADRMLKIGDATGDWKPIDRGIGRIIEINALNQPDPPESMEEQIPKMGYLLTLDATQVKRGAKRHTPEQLAAMFKRYGVKADVWQEALDAGHSTADEFDAEGNYIRQTSNKDRETDDVCELPPIN